MQVCFFSVRPTYCHVNQELVGDRMKRGKEAELAEQLQALRCLSLLIVFVGRHLADFVPLMMTLLARATELSAPDVQLQALAAWSLFIKYVQRFFYSRCASLSWAQRNHEHVQLFSVGLVFGGGG